MTLLIICTLIAWGFIGLNWFASLIETGVIDSNNPSTFEIKAMIIGGPIIWLITIWMIGVILFETLFYK